MLLGLDKRFLFIAGTKCGSTTVEFALRPACELALTQTDAGKHLRYQDAMKVCAPLLAVAGLAPQDLFRFGVVRDPLDWVVSWYNYLGRPQVGHRADKADRTTRDVSFEDYAAAITRRGERPAWARLGDQHRMFLNPKGQLGVDYLVPLPRLEEDLAAIRAALGIVRGAPEPKRLNVSPSRIRPEDVPAATAAALRARFARDGRLFERAMARGFGAPAEIVARKRKAAGARARLQSAARAGTEVA